MKLILESWNKFLTEQEINEATEQEIEYLEDALNIPIDEMPFANIFGDSYRIIEPLDSLDETSSFGVAMKALENMGWQVGSPKDGKILCSKTKVTHYIDGRGKQGISRKTIKLNLPKVLSGIINFVNNSRDKLDKESAAEVFEAAKRYAYAKKQGKLDKLPADVKYNVPPRILDPVVKVTANEYRKIMKLYDNQNYWIGITTSSNPKDYFKSMNINFESFQNFAKYASDSFDDLINNMDQYVQKNYIIYSRHPVDVFRMSDHQGIQSCHSLPSEKGDVSFDEYNKCALSEAFGNGMIAYIVPAKNFKMFPPTQESLDKVNDEEIFYDEKRPSAGELVPTSRIRIKHVTYHSGPDAEEPIRIAVPQGKIYGPKVPGFIDAVGRKMATTQKQEINDIIKAAGKIYGEGHVQMNGFTRYGGSYQDTGYSIVDTIPKLFRRVSKDVEFHGRSVRYEPDVEEALLASIGQNAAEITKQRLNEIFDEYTGGFIRFDWDVDEDYDGSVFYRWSLFVSFDMKIPTTADIRDIRNAVTAAVDSYFPDYYGFPQSDNVFISKVDQDTFRIQLVYDGRELGDKLNIEVMNLYGLEENLPSIMKKMDAFDYYYDDGPIQLVEFILEEYGILPTERNKVKNIVEKYDLRDDSWWNVAEEESGENDFFGGEYLDFISFEDYTTLELSEIKEKIPENMKQAAYKHMADFLNIVMSSDEVSGKLALNQNTWNKEKDPNIVIMYDGNFKELKAEDLDDYDDIDIRAGVSMYNDYSQEILDKTGNYLKNNASIDDLNERILEQLKQYLADKLQAKNNITENKRRVKIRVRR